MYPPIEEKRLDPFVATDYSGDMPDEIDQWFAGMISVREMTLEGKKLLLEMFEGDDRNKKLYESIKRSIGENDGREEVE